MAPQQGERQEADRRTEPWAARVVRIGAGSMECYNQYVVTNML